MQNDEFVPRPSLALRGVPLAAAFPVSEPVQVRVLISVRRHGASGELCSVPLLLFQRPLGAVHDTAGGCVRARILRLPLVGGHVDGSCARISGADLSLHGCRVAVEWPDYRGKGDLRAKRTAWDTGGILIQLCEERGM